MKRRGERFRYKAKPPRLKLPTAKPEVERPGFLSYWDALEAPTFTYFIQDESGAIKIGQAKKPMERLGLLQCGNPRALHLRMVLPHDVEYGMHWRFKEWRIRGEWFGRDETEQQVILAYADRLNAEAREDWDGSAEAPENREWLEMVDYYMRTVYPPEEEAHWSEKASDLRREGLGVAAIAKELEVPEPEVAEVLLRKAA